MVKENNYPRQMEVGLIGSMHQLFLMKTSHAPFLSSNRRDEGVPVKANFLINPGSEQIRYTAERDGILEVFQDAGATIIANACGPCIGQWKRDDGDSERTNTIVTSFNRNFAKKERRQPQYPRVCYFPSW